MRITPVRGEPTAITIRLAGPGFDDVEIRVSAGGVQITEGIHALTEATSHARSPDYLALQTGQVRVYYDSGILEVYSALAGPAAVICNRHATYASTDIELSARFGAPRAQPASHYGHAVGPMLMANPESPGMRVPAISTVTPRRGVTRISDLDADQGAPRRHQVHTRSGLTAARASPTARARRQAHAAAPGYEGGVDLEDAYPGRARARREHPDSAAPDKDPGETPNRRKMTADFGSGREIAVEHVVSLGVGEAVE
jgi:hypothetical protein